MPRASLLIATSLLAAVIASEAALAEGGLEFRPYFGAAYERGWMKFKDTSPQDTTLYGDKLAGYAPFVGVTMGKNFAFELSLRAAYGTGGSVTGTPITTTTTAAGVTTTVVSKLTTTDHSSSLGVGLDFLVRYPLGKTGFEPFLLAGLSIANQKEISQTDSAIVTTVGTTAPKNTNDTSYTVLIRKKEASPEFGIGLAYSYSGAELRVLGRIQNLNMDNNGQYVLTLSAGLLRKV